MDVWYSGDYGITFYEYGTEREPLGRYLAHTWKNLSLIPTVRPFVVPATVKKSELETNAVFGKVDTSRQLTGFPLFNNREGSWTFYIVESNDYSEHIQDSELEDVLDSEGDPLLSTTVQGFSAKYAQLQNLFQGREVAVVLDEDPEHFYKGTVEISEYVASNDGSLNGFTLSYDLYPFKMELEETEVSLDLSDYGTVYRGSDPSYYTEIPCASMPVIPYILFSNNANGKGYDLLFMNGETGVNVTNPSSTNISGNANSAQKLYAKYSEYRPTILLTNYTRVNKCYMRIGKHSSSSSSPKPDWVKLIYRKGEL